MHARTFMPRWSLLALMLSTVGCVVVPLPDATPPLQEVRLPQAGDDVAEVRRVFGEPELLDSGQFLLYDWGTDRRFVLVPTIPLGIPAAGVFAGERFRMRVVLDAERKVVRSDCSGSLMTFGQLAGLGCIDPPRMFAAPGPAEARQLSTLPELAEAGFWNAEMAGSNTPLALSPDGRLLAAADTSNRTWIVDLERFTVLGRHDGQRPDLWSWKAGGEPRIAFDRDGRRLVIEQNDITPAVILVRHGDSYLPAGSPDRADLVVADFACCPKGLVGLVADEAVWVAMDGTPIARSGAEGRIGFDRRGAEITRTAARQALRLADLDTGRLTRSPRATFVDNGPGGVILDTRPNSARNHAATDYAFSPDGRLLARNSCRHLELWESAALGASLVGDGPRALSPRQAMILPVRKGSADHWCHAPVAFDPSATWIAAAGADAIHLWRVDDGRLLGSVFTAEVGHGLHVVEIALDAEGRLTAVLSSYRGALSVARWRFGTKAGAG